MSVPPIADVRSMIAGCACVAACDPGWMPNSMGMRVMVHLTSRGSPFPVIVVSTALECARMMHMTSLIPLDV